MWQRFTVHDLRVIGHYLGVLVLFFSITMGVALITAILCQEWEPAARYFCAMGISLIIGSALRFLRIEPTRLSRQQALAVTGLAWIVIASVASIPLYGSGHYASYLDALFDGVSGLTTTGATLLSDLDHLSNADNMFRFMIHFVGALGVIVVAMSLGIFGKRGGGGSGLFTSEGRSEHVVPNVVQTTQMILRITLSIIAVAAVIMSVFCLMTGMEPLRAVLHSFWLSTSGFATNGFAPMSQSIIYYHSFPVEVVLMVLMILGSIPFVLHSELFRGKIITFFKDIETKTMALWLLVATLVFASSLCTSDSFAELPALLRRGVFMIISTFSTSGFQNITSNQLTTVLSSGALLTLALIMAIGGGAGSTSGGIKFFRIGIVFKSIVATVKEALSPDSARVTVAYSHLGRRMLTPELVKEAMTVLILYAITYLLGALVGIAHGYEATQAIFQSVSMASNTGLNTGIVSPDMPISLEIFYIFQMWAGRLEFVTFLAIMVQIVVSLKPRKRVVQA